MSRKMVIVTFGLAALLGADLSRAQQGPAGFDLALVDVDGTKKVLGQLPPTVYAPRISPDGSELRSRRAICRAPMDRGSGQRRCRTSLVARRSRSSSARSTGRRCGHRMANVSCSSYRAKIDPTPSTGVALTARVTPST